MNPEWFLVFASGLSGLLFGSFANVCGHRIPLQISIVSPRSRCPVCEHEIAWHDNIPLVSWLMLGGKCRNCRTPISIRYPLLELLMGLSWAGLAWKFGWNPVLIQALVLISLLWVLTLIDLETGLLPNLLTFSGIAAGLLFSFWLGHFTDAIIGAVVGTAFILLTRGQMRAEIPFGPYLAAAGVVWFLWGGEILQWYAGLIRG